MKRSILTGSDLLVLLAVASAHAFAQSPTSSPLPTISMPAIVQCMAWSLCQQRLIELLPAGCYTIECNCVAKNQPAYIDCLKKQCEDKWQAVHEEEMKTCTETFHVDVSGNKTYTGITVPTPTMNTTWSIGIFNGTVSDDGGLKLSDKIALGVGIGFGVPTVLVGIGAWLRARRRGNREPKDENTS